MTNKSLFEKAFDKATDYGDWYDMVLLARNRKISRNDFADVLSWLPRAQSDIQQQLLQYIANYFVNLDNLTERDLALIERFPQLLQQMRQHPQCKDGLLFWMNSLQRKLK